MLSPEPSQLGPLLRRARLQMGLSFRALRDRVLRELYGGLWHTTHPDRFKGILAAGAILPEPGIPDRERWGELLKALNTILTSELSAASVFSTSISLNPRLTTRDVPGPLGRILFPVTSPGSALSGLS